MTLVLGDEIKGGMNMAKKKETIEEVVEETVEEVVEPEEVIEEDKPVIGVVSNCTALRVRAEGNTDATVVGILTVGDEVEIIEESSTEEFYKIYREHEVGVTVGFCMKKFITIKE